MTKKVEKAEILMMMKIHLKRSLHSSFRPRGRKRKNPSSRSSNYPGQDSRRDSGSPGLQEQTRGGPRQAELPQLSPAGSLHLLLLQ